MSYPCLRQPARRRRVLEDRIRILKGHATLGEDDDGCGERRMETHELPRTGRDRLGRVPQIHRLLHVQPGLSRSQNFTPSADVIRAQELQTSDER
jgi:hypothetical protein